MEQTNSTVIINPKQGREAASPHKEQSIRTEGKSSEATRQSFLPEQTNPCKIYDIRNHNDDTFRESPPAHDVTRLSWSTAQTADLQRHLLCNTTLYRGPTYNHHLTLMTMVKSNTRNLMRWTQDSATTLQQTPTSSTPEDNNKWIFKWSWKTLKYSSLPATGCALKTNCTI